MPQFEHPFMLLLLLGLPLLWRKRRPADAIAFPAILGFKPQRQGLKQRCLMFMPALRIASLALLIIALAQPMLRPVRVLNSSDGLAIQIVLDRSASMATEDMKYERKSISRLDAVKRLSYEFIFGNGHGLQGRPNDKVGLIVFAADPITLSPLTLSHETLRGSIANLQLPKTLEEDGTAIGDAVALAAARLHVSAGSSSHEGVSKIIILITDGENNMGERTPEQAAALARQWGVKLYAITIRPESVDTKRDKEIESVFASLAASTGGMAQTVKDGSAFEAIYREIDRMEPAHLESIKRSDDGRAVTWSLLAVLIALVSELALRETWLRKAPA